MPDPFGTAAAAITLVGQTISGLQTLQGYISKYNSADLTILSTVTECSTIHSALLQIQQLIVQNGILQQSPTGDDHAAYNLRDFEGVLGTCAFTFGVLNERLSRLNVDGLNKYNESTVMSKIRAVWNEDEMDKLRNNIRGLVGAIQLLLTVSLTA